MPNLGMRKWTFSLSDGRNLEVEGRGKNDAFSQLRTKHGDSIKEGTVIGLGVAKPLFWLKRGTQYYGISAATASVCAHTAGGANGIRW